MDPKAFLSLLVEHLPTIIFVLGSVGALAWLAAKIRRAVSDARAAAAKTPTVVDDVLVDLVDGPLLEVADLIERGDLEGAKKKVDAVRGLVKRAGR